MAVPHDIGRLERIRHVTAHYLDYQGLYMLLLGLFALNLLLLRTGSPVPLMIGVPVIVALGLGVRAYYHRRFGRVRPTIVPARLSGYVLVCVAFLVLPAAVAATSARVGATGEYVGAGGLVFAALFLVLASTNWRLKAHYLLAAIVIGAASLLPLGPLMPSGLHPFGFGSVGVLLVVFAAVAVVGGLIDHRTLVRALPPVTDAVTENGTD